MKREKRVLNTFYKDIVVKGLKNMSFERSEGIKRVMNGNLKDEKLTIVSNSPVCKECAEYL